MSTPVVECAFFKIREGKLEAFSQARKRMLKVLPNYDGYIDMKTYRSVDNPQRFFDYVTWESAEKAKKAAEDIMDDPEAQDFIKSVEKIRAMEYMLPFE